jgi:uroporphyrinogen decarboxylase
MDHDHIALLGSVRGPLTGAWLLMGFENISYALYDDPTLISEVLNISNDYFKEAARLSVEAGCTALFVTEDLGDNNRGFFRLEHFRKYFLPPLADLVEYIDGLNVPVLLHSDGRITDYLEDLTQTKITAIHPLQRIAGMDLRDFKEKYGRRFCIIGNIDFSRTLPFGSLEDVAAEVREAIDIAAPGGGYILASDNSLHDGIPIENIVAMFRVGREYGGSFYEDQGLARIG